MTEETYIIPETEFKDELKKRIADYNDPQAGTSVWSIEMGGIGPGYEQAIQDLSIEMLDLLLLDYKFVNDRDLQDKVLMKYCEDRGYSGAQWGAARNLAYHLYRKGLATLDEPEIKDRKILVHSTR